MCPSSSKPARRRCLNTRGHTHEERGAHKAGETRQANRRKCRIAQRPDHGGINNIQEVLRHHPANDGQRESKDMTATVGYIRIVGKRMDIDYLTMWEIVLVYEEAPNALSVTRRHLAVSICCISSSVGAFGHVGRAEFRTSHGCPLAVQTLIAG